MCFFYQLVDFKAVGSFYVTTIVVILLIEGTLVFPYLFGMLLYFQMPFLCPVLRYVLMSPYISFISFFVFTNFTMLSVYAIFVE